MATGQEGKLSQKGLEYAPLPIPEALVSQPVSRTAMEGRQAGRETGGPRVGHDMVEVTSLVAPQWPWGVSPLSTPWMGKREMESEGTWEWGWASSGDSESETQVRYRHTCPARASLSRCTHVLVAHM